jgi:alpha-tubulin suppressor-like RCC1 family protein
MSRTHAILAALCVAHAANASTVNARFTSPADIPVTAYGYTANGNDLNLSLEFDPPTGTELTIVRNTASSFISGRFSNLAHGQELSFDRNGIIYHFVANYHGGTGNDLVLVWQRQGVYAWGKNWSGQLGNNNTVDSKVPVPVDENGVLAGRTVISVASGMSHSVALCSDGTVVAWGYNGYGQLGNNSTTDSKVPVRVYAAGVLAGRTVVAVAAGESFSMALCSDGTIVTWGANDSSQLGNNSTMTSSMVPVRVYASGVLAGRSVVAVAAGSSHALALCSDGTVTAWGSNSSGRLGNNSTISSRIPVAVDASGVLADKVVTAVAAGSSHSLAMCLDGTVAAWGYNNTGQLGNNSTTASLIPVAVDTTGVLADRTVVAVSAGGSFSLALCSDGRVAAWGANDDGELGNNSSVTTSKIPVLVDATGVLAGKTVVGIAAGFHFASARCQDGSLVSWGYNNYGQLGNGGTSTSRVPVLVNGLGLPAGWKSGMTAGGGDHILMLAALPPGSRLRSLVVNPGTLQPEFTFARREYFANVDAGCHEITVTAETLDASRITINGADAVSGTPSAAIPLGAGLNFITVRVTGQGADVADYVLTVVAGGVLTADFTNTMGPLVTASSFDLTGYEARVSLAFTPPVGASLTMLRGTGITRITGRFSNIAQGQLLELSYQGRTFRYVANYFGGTGNDLVLEWANRRIASWGDNGYGQLGNGTLTSSAVPVPADPAGVLAGKTVTSIFSSSSATLACCVDGTLAAWGGNSYGQLGIGTKVDSTVPVIINGMGALAGKTVVAVSGGNVTSLAVCDDGTVMTWGDNFYGMLGNGTTTLSTIPVAVKTDGVLAGKFVVAAAVGGGHCVALCADGTLVTWGNNDLGQLGTWGTTSSSVPVRVYADGALLGKSVVAVGAGLWHSLVLCSDGTLVAWGDNSYGQIGNGTTTSSYTEPVVVSSGGVLAGKSVTAIAVSAITNLALCTDDSMVSWGGNTSGQLGNNSLVNSRVPVLVNTSALPAGMTATNICEGGYGAFAACADGSAIGWGSNSVGQLGDGTLTTRKVPVVLDGTGEFHGKRVLAIASGGGHSHAILAEPDSGYVAWMSGRTGLTNKTESADPDHDGLDNLTEYVFNGNPAANSRGLGPAIIAEGAGRVVRFRRLAASTEDCAQWLQYSGDMIHWTEVSLARPPGQGVVIGASGTDGMETVTLTVPESAGAQWFARLKISRP